MIWFYFLLRRRFDDRDAIDAFDAFDDLDIRLVSDAIDLLSLLSVISSSASTIESMVDCRRAGTRRGILGVVGVSGCRCFVEYFSNVAFWARVRRAAAM